MRKTMNKYFSYPGKELWDVNCSAAVPAIPLTERVSEINSRLYRIPARPAEEQRRDGYYHAKAFLYVHDDMLARLDALGLTFHTMGLADMSYITIAPKSHMDSPLRYDDDIDTLVVMVSADTSDPNYGMYTLEKYADYIDAAAREGMILHFAMDNNTDAVGRVFSTVRESLVIHRFNYRRVYLDLTGLYASGETLKDIPGFSIPGAEDPDGETVRLTSLGIPALNISRLWVRSKRLTGMPSHGRFHNMDFNPQQYVCSAMGRRRADAALRFEPFDSVYDPALSQMLRDMGARMDIRQTKGEQWITISPLQALETGEKLPLVAFFGEVNAYDSAQAVDTLMTAWPFVDLAAQGNYILLFFALEDLDDNDLLAELIQEAAEKLPVDLSRVYVTGHSHNGRFTAEFTRRHQRLVAAAAPLGNEPGQLSPEWTSGFFAITDEQLDKQAAVDTPVIMLNGCNEINCMYPLYTDAPFPNPATPFIALNTADKRVKSWQRRLRSMNCPMKSEEEIYAAARSSDYVERTLGIPADRTDVLYIDGVEVYTADLKNVNGDWRLRICAFQNCPHETTPTYADMMWSFCRRFARDQETGETLELFRLK